MRRACRLSFLSIFLASSAVATVVPPVPVTPAEAREFRATPSYDETLAFIHELTEISPHIRLRSYGRSPQGRELPLVIVSGKGVFTAAAARASGRPVVLIQNGIHSGEIDGKDACLMLLRDLAVGLYPELLERLTLLVVPIYNVDGHERVSPHNRPNQDGPVEGMGFRTTTDGHDLNRDHLKLQTPEARATIGLFNSWRPHLHVDNHVTNGSDHDWVLTYSWAEAPQLAAPVDAWLATHMPRVREATEAAGHRIGPYVGLLDRTDPSAGFSSVIAEPRFATGYYPLRNRPSILVENHAYKPYRARVLANRDFLLALLQEIAREPDTLVDAVRRAEQHTVELGLPDAAPSAVVLRYRPAEPETVRFPVYDWHTEPSRVTGTPLLRFDRGELREIEVPWIHRLVPDRTVPRPRGYFLLPGWPSIERRLTDHDLRFRRLDESLEIEVETMRISRADKPPPSSYQGLTRVDVQVERRSELRRLPTGTLWIPADQPDFEVAAQMLEPDAPDSLVRWGLLSQIMERKEYIAPAVLEDLATKMLDDPETAAEWNRALEDETFAADRGARYEWWYRRTVYWDETVGLMPVMRLLAAPEF